MKDEYEMTGTDAAIILLAMFPMLALDGLILSLLWRWFVVTTFDLPQIGVAQAIGISLVFECLRGHDHGGIRKPVIEWIFDKCLFAGMALFIAGIVRAFI